MRVKGTLIEWNDDRGFGFIRTHDTGARIFLHIAALPAGAYRPRIGDTLDFEIETDAQGRARAIAVAYNNLDRAGLAPMAPTRRDRPPTPRPRTRRQEHHRTRAWPLLAMIGLAALAGVWWQSSRVPHLSSDTVETTASALPQQDRPATLRPTTTHAPGYRCDGRTHCSQMTSCAEARFFLNHCPGTEMDGNGDGVPCEQQWCRG